MKLEAKIGLFVLMGLTALFMLSTQVTKLGKWEQDNYRVHAYIKDASGLELQTNVTMNGVDIGEIADIVIENRRVKLTLSIQRQVAIPVDSMLIIMQESVLGAKAVNIVAGESKEDMKEGGLITQNKRYAPFDETSDSVNAAANELELLMRDLRDVLGDEQKSDLKEAIKAFRNVGVHLDEVVLENRSELKKAIANMSRMGEGFSKTADTVNGDLPKIMERIDSMTRRLDTISASLEHKLPEAVDKFIAIEDDVSGVIKDNRDSLKRALVSADNFFDSGEEAFKKVDEMLSNFTVSELQVGIHTDYMMYDEYAKPYITIAYLPNPDTYYLFDVSGMRNYKETDAAGNVLEVKKHKGSEVHISAQYGKRFGDFLLRGGIIESTGGWGMDYLYDHDRLMVSVDAFDFNAINDLRGRSPHLKFNVRYRWLRHLEFYGGWDNVLNSDAQNLYFGIGMKFIDNQMKYLLGSAASAL